MPLEEDKPSAESDGSWLSVPPTRGDGGRRTQREKDIGGVRHMIRRIVGPVRGSRIVGGNKQGSK